MIAIPNMEKPKRCQECPAHTFNYGYIPGDNGCRILKCAFNIDKLDINPFNEVLPDCPLIEIDESDEIAKYICGLRRKEKRMRSIDKRLTKEDKFSRKFACWANNHKGWSKAKTRNRRLARRKIRRGEWEGKNDE